MKVSLKICIKLLYKGPPYSNGHPAKYNVMQKCDSNVSRMLLKIIN